MMRWSRNSITPILLTIGALVGDGSAQVYEIGKLTASDSMTGDRLGQVVALAGGRALAGQHRSMNVPITGFVYAFDSTSGQLLNKFSGLDSNNGDYFGYSLATAGDHVAVGAPYDDDNAFNSGSAFLFNAATGQQLLKVAAFDAASEDRLGLAVALTDQWLVAGAPYDDGPAGIDSGSVYVFDSTTGLLQHKLTPSDISAYDGFGEAVAASGNLLIAASYHDDDHGAASGSVYVFDLQSGQQLHKLTASDAAAQDYFGFSLAIEGGTAVIGAPHKMSASLLWVGATYVFDAVSGQEIHKLTASDAAQYDEFGESIAISGNLALIGAFQKKTTGPYSGGTYIFDVTTGEELHRITVADNAIYDEFGQSVAIDGDTLLVGAPGVNKGKGSAYILYVPFIPHGAGCPGTGGVVPRLEMGGVGEPGGQVQIRILGGVGSGSALLFMGWDHAEVAMGFGCTLNVSPLLPMILGPVPLFPTGPIGPGEGSISIPATIPLNIVPPVTVNLQAFILDPGSPSGYSNTNGVELDIR